jgi:protein TonB
VQRVRLVYVDPAPAAPPRGTVNAESPSAEPLRVPPPPVPQPKRAPARKATKPILAKKTAPEPAPPPPAAAPAAPDSASAPPMPAAPGSAPSDGDGRGETVGGSTGEGGRGTGSGPFRVGEVATAPVLVTRVVPEYPRHARLAGIEGEVVLEVIVDRHGRVTSDVRVMGSVPELERAAVAAVLRWRFRPARVRAGAAGAVLMEVPVRFVLHEATAAASSR